MSTEHATTDAAVAGTLLVLWGSHLRRPLWINRIYILWSEWRGGRNNSTLRGRHVWKPPFLCRINSLLSCTRVREPQAAAVTGAPQLKVHNFAPWSISYDDHDDGPNERTPRSTIRRCELTILIRRAAQSGSSDVIRAVMK